MTRLLPAALVLAVLTGCEVARGFRDEGARQLGDLAVEEFDRRLEGDLRDTVTAVVEQVKESIPKKDPAGDGLLYSLGALAAYIVGSFGKGKLREARDRKKASA